MIPRNIPMSRHDCAQHGHAWCPSPWGPHCCFCGLPLPEWERRKGDWVALGEKSMVWVPR